MLEEYGCLHFKFSVLLGVSTPAHTKEQLAQLKANDKKTFEFEGKKYTKYEASQTMSQIESRVKKLKDRANIAAAAGDDDLRREEQYKINLLTNKYAQLSKASGLPTKMERMQRINVSHVAAKSAVRNTQTVLKYNEKSDFTVKLEGLSDKVNEGISQACRKVAEMGGKNNIEFLSLINLETGNEEFFEEGNEFSVGSRKFWDFIATNTNKKFAFIHNHNTDGYFSETDMRTLLKNEPISMFGAIRIDGVKYFTIKTTTLEQSVSFDKLLENELKDLNYKSRNGIISSAERTKAREEIIVDTLLDRYTKGLIELDGR